MAIARQHAQKQLQPLPFSPAEWKEIALALRLTAQQTRIVEILMRGGRDKQIAAALGIEIPTIRTHFRQIFRNLAVTDRLELVLRVFAVARTASTVVGHHHSGLHPKGLHHQ